MASLLMPILVADDDTIIGMKSIESMKFTKSAEDSVVDTLKDKPTFTITTVSGMVYEISLKRQVETLSDTIHGMPTDTDSLKKHIFNSWYKYQQSLGQ